jgi:hypothetical protein
MVLLGSLLLVAQSRSALAENDRTWGRTPAMPIRSL